eukprot:scaffold36228_cov129-Isochrysis_galbana.AAC.1
MPVSRWSAPAARPPAIERARLRGRPRRTLSALPTHTGCRGGRGQRCPGQVSARLHLRTVQSGNPTTHPPLLA